jgi:transposase-like protein
MMRNFLFVTLLMLTVISCGHSVENKSDSDREKQSITTTVHSKANAANETILTSNITCPKCGYSAKEQLPTEVCQISYTCKKCKTTLHPKKGDCCVFCSYGDHKCPSKQ